MNSNIKVLITGASGTIGTEVLHQLVNLKNIQITVFDIKTKKSKQLFKPYSNRINVIYGDLNKSEDILSIPDNLDVVIHLAAVIPPLADEHPELAYKVNVLGTKSIIEQLEKKSPKVFFLYSSSISVYGDRVSNPMISLQDPCNPSEGDTYGRTKIDAENLIQNSKLNWSIFRLAAIMKNHKISKLMFHMPLATKLEICTAKDTAKAFVEGIFKKQELSGKIYNLGGGESCCTTYRDFIVRSFLLFKLGALNFPQTAFATRNFHCGYYADGNLLENILHFRSDTFETYFEQTNLSISPIIKFFCFVFRNPIKSLLLRQSEPYNALRTNNTLLIERFFGNVGFTITT